MKLGKLSLVAVMALGTSAFAIDNVKVNGEARFIYQTSNVELTPTEKAAGLESGLFKQGNGALGAGAPYSGAAAGGAALIMGVTADLVQNISAGAEVQAFTTLGLENNLVQDVMAPGDTIEDSSIMSQAWLAASLGKTTVKLGRMELDTPLAFTEKWNIVKNTFEGAVALNNDLPDTTLVAAWVGKHNGNFTATTNATHLQNDVQTAFGVNLLGGSTGRTANMNSFDTFGKDGAYAAAVVNKSIPNTTVQAWYYDVVNVAQAYWLQADTKVAGMVNVGVQYANMNPSNDVDAAASTILGAPVSFDDSTIWAAKASADVAGFNVYAAYSKAGNDGVLGFANVATGDKTSIYTGLGSIYMDGVVTTPGASTYKIGASTKMVPGVGLAASYCNASDLWDISGNDVSAWDISATGKVGPVDLQAIYTQVSNDTAGSVTLAPGHILSTSVYAGRDIDSLRIIASLKF